MMICRLVRALCGARYILTLLVAATALFALGGCQEPPPPPPPPAPEDLGPPPHPVFTQAQFDALLYGMTTAQVREVLGAEADRQESTYSKGGSEYVPPTLTAWYIWENEDGSFIRLGFVDKKLAEMEAEDLPQ